MLSASTAADELQDQESPEGQEQHPDHWRAQHKPGKLASGGCCLERQCPRPLLMRLVILEALGQVQLPVFASVSLSGK